MVHAAQSKRGYEPETDRAKEKAVAKTETLSTHFLVKHEESNEIRSLVKRLI